MPTTDIFPLMWDDDEPIPWRESSTMSRNPGSVSLDDRLENIDKTLAKLEEQQGAIIKQLTEGSVTFASVALRLRALEVVVYGACGLALMGVAGALLLTVVRQPAIQQAAQAPTTVIVP